MRTILYLKASDLYSGRSMLAGFMDFSRERDWNVQVFDPVLRIAELRRLVDFWHPDGVVLNCGSGHHDFASRHIPCPVVYLNRPASQLHDGDSFIFHDSRATAELAARELLAGSRTSFGYVGWHKALNWDNERREAFVRALALNQRTVYFFETRGESPDDSRLGNRLLKWLTNLPRPVGIFASTDIFAAKVLATAAKAGLSVPADLSVIGVDNDTDICEYAQPTISSVEPDWRLAGRLAAETLAQLIDHPTHEPIRHAYPPLRLVRRQSSHCLRHNDREVASALELIRRKACSGLTAAQVADSFACSRRMAEIRFRQLTGMSFLQAIRQRRLETACALLTRRDKPLAAIANFCGYRSQGAFTAFVKAETGHLPKDIRGAWCRPGESMPRQPPQPT